METETPFWALGVVLPVACAVAGIAARDSVGPFLAGLLWLALAFKHEGRQRAVCVGGLVMLAAFAGLVVWAVKGRP